MDPAPSHQPIRSGLERPAQEGDSPVEERWKKIVLEFPSTIPRFGCGNLGVTNSQD